MRGGNTGIEGGWYKGYKKGCGIRGIRGGWYKRGVICNLRGVAQPDSWK